MDEFGTGETLSQVFNQFVSCVSQQNSTYATRRACNQNLAEVTVAGLPLDGFVLGVLGRHEKLLSMGSSGIAVLVSSSKRITDHVSEKPNVQYFIREGIKRLTGHCQNDSAR